MIPLVVATVDYSAPCPTCGNLAGWRSTCYSTPEASEQPRPWTVADLIGCAACDPVVEVAA